MTTRGRPRTKFAVDAMLGSLARKLRAFGFDASYYKAGDDTGLLQTALNEGRILLTSDFALASRAASKQVKAILLTQKGDGARIAAIAKACKEDRTSLSRGDPMCSLCGGELERLRKDGLSTDVPPSVLASHRLFFRCLGCGQVYWRGSHWKKLRSLARRLS